MRVSRRSQFRLKDKQSTHLVQIRRPDAPGFARKSDVVRVVNLAQVVEGASLLRVRQNVFPAIVRDLDKAFFNVDVRSAILAHGPKLDLQVKDMGPFHTRSGSWCGDLLKVKKPVVSGTEDKSLRDGWAKLDADIGSACHISPSLICMPEEDELGERMLI
jgi:hypothetical protein